MAGIRFPDDPFATFSGTLYLVPPAGSAPAQLIVTDATIRNETDPPGGVSGGVLVRSGLPLACGEFQMAPDPDTGGPPSGILMVLMDGSLERLDGMDQTSRNEELEITGVAPTLTVPGEPWTPPAEVTASWIAPGPVAAPAAIGASAAKSGVFAVGHRIGSNGLRVLDHV